MSTTHNKHSKLIRPVKGKFHRCEWAIMGTDCTRIKQLANLIIHQLQDKFNGGFLDMKHDDESHQEFIGRTIIEHNDGSREIKTSGHNPSIPFTDWTSEDFVLINGNHYAAKKQIIVTDSVKENSLRKRTDQLNDVGLLLLTTENEIPQYIKEMLPQWEKIPSLHINETEKITEYLFHEITNQLPPIKALVLAGGKSSRMGEDKGEICWYSKAQKYHLADLLSQYSDEVYISCQADHIPFIDSNYKGLADQFLDLGPFGAILTGFKTDPNSAWLIVACDLPLVDAKAIETLIQNRNASKIATTYYNSETDFPDPLLSIWEPKAYPFLLQYLSQGISCPRKVLINNPIKAIDPIDPKLLMNANTQEDRSNIKAIIAKRQSESVPHDIV